MNIAILITLGNLICGLLSLILTITYPKNIIGRSWLLIIALIFDLCDGRVARKLGQTSLLGAYLDSLSDIVSFGVAPALLVLLPILHRYHTSPIAIISICITCIFVCCSAWRLARFHTIIQHDPTIKVPYYLGMPITVNGIIFPLRLMINNYIPYGFEVGSLSILIISSYLMISTHKFPKW